jgi:predicted dehydrogenase
MSQKPLKTACLGLAPAGQFLIECAQRTGLFKIETIADKDLEAAQRLARPLEAQAFDDIRLALAQNQIEVVFACTGLNTCGDHLRSAMARKLHVFRICPPARNLDELASFEKQAGPVAFAVASTWRCRQSFKALKDYLAQNPEDSIQMVSAQVGLGPYQDVNQRDPKICGGGILLYSCYQLIDQIVSILGPPNRLYCNITSQAPDRQQRLYVVEDTAMLQMEFTDTLITNITASKLLKPETDTLKLYTKDKIITLGGTGLCVTDLTGAPVHRAEFSDTESDRMAELLTNFARFASGEPDTKLISNALNNFDTMAVIDAAYLSARTGMPETPQRIMQLSQTAASRILSAASRRTL